MSDRASLWRLLKELDKATRTEQAIIAEEAILKLFDTVRDEMYADTEKLRAELAEARAEVARYKDMASHFHTEIDHCRATWITEHAERIRLEERLKLANATVKFMAEDSGYDSEVER